MDWGEVGRDGASMRRERGGVVGHARSAGCPTESDRPSPTEPDQPRPSSTRPDRVGLWDSHCGGTCDGTGVAPVWHWRGAVVAPTSPSSYADAGFARRVPAEAAGAAVALVWCQGGSEAVVALAWRWCGTSVALAWHVHSTEVALWLLRYGWRGAQRHRGGGRTGVAGVALVLLLILCVLLLNFRAWLTSVTVVLSCCSCCLRPSESVRNRSRQQQQQQEQEPEHQQQREPRQQPAKLFSSAALP